MYKQQKEVSAREKELWDMWNDIIKSTIKKSQSKMLKTDLDRGSLGDILEYIESTWVSNLKEYSDTVAYDSNSEFTSIYPSSESLAEFTQKVRSGAQKSGRRPAMALPTLSSDSPALKAKKYDGLSSEMEEVSMDEEEYSDDPEDKIIKSMLAAPLGPEDRDDDRFLDENDEPIIKSFKKTLDNKGESRNYIACECEVSLAPGKKKEIKGTISNLMMTLHGADYWCPSATIDLKLNDE